MNIFNTIILRRKLFKYPALIMIFLLNACAFKYPILSHGSNERVTTNSSEHAATDARNCLPCSANMLEKNSTRPKIQTSNFGIPNRRSHHSHVEKSSRKGAKIVLLLHNQPEIAGRLLSVRDDALVISTKTARENPIDKKTPTLITIKNQNIRAVIVKGESKVLKSAGTGFLVGAGIGVVLGLVTGDDRPCERSYSEGYSLIFLLHFNVC